MVFSERCRVKLNFRATELISSVNQVHKETFYIPFQHPVMNLHFHQPKLFMQHLEK